MQIVILAGFAIALTFQEIPAPGGWGYLPAVGLGVYLLGLATLSGLGTTMLLRKMVRTHQRANAAGRGHQILVIATRLWLLGGLVGLMLMGYASWVTEMLGPLPVPLLDEAALLGPLVAGVLLMWALEYPFHRAMRCGLGAQHRVHPSDTPEDNTFWSRWEHLVYNIRHHLLFIAVPVGLILLIHDGLGFFVEPHLPEEVKDAVLNVLMFVSAGTVFFLAPLLIVRIWKTHRMPDAPLREELELLCRKLKHTYRDILNRSCRCTGCGNTGQVGNHSQNIIGIHLHGIQMRSKFMR